MTRSQRGGNIFSLVGGGLLYIINVVGGLFIHTGSYVAENIQEILYHVLLLLAYVMCFYYLQFKNTEIPSFLVLVVLHLIFLGVMLAIKVKLPVMETGNPWSVGTFSIYVLSVGWIFVAVALGLVLKIYYDLYHTFVVQGGIDIQFGGAETVRQYFVQTLLYAVILMWGFYLLEYLKTNDVLLLNVVFLVLALVLVCYAIYHFIHQYVVMGVIETVASFISMACIQYINEHPVDYAHFFTQHPIVNNVILLVGIVFNLVAVVLYYMASTLAEQAGSIALPDVLQMNPAYHEGFVMTQTIQGKECQLDSQDPELYTLLKTPHAGTMDIIANNFCSEPTPPAPTPTVPNIQDRLLSMWNNREDPPSSTSAPSFFNLVESSSKYVPINDRPTAEPTTTPTPFHTVGPTPSHTVSPTPFHTVGPTHVPTTKTV